MRHKKKKGGTFFQHAHALLVCLCLFFSASTAAQAVFRLQIVPLDSADAGFVKKKISIQPTYPDTASVKAELQKLVAQLHGQAFLEASFDSISRRDSLITAWLHLGRPYSWAKLGNGNVEQAYLDRSGFRPRLYNGKPLHFSEILLMQQRLLEQAENNGFPFASIRLDSVQWPAPTPLSEELAITASIFMEKGRLVRFDSLLVEGDLKISQNYLRQYLGIHEGEPYSRQKVLKIRGRLQALPFLKEKKNATVSFLEEGASIRLSLEKKKASRFDFLLGVLPNNASLDQKLLITGTFNAEFNNQFGLGERIYASFERLRPQTQRLELALSYPYMLQLPFGVDLKFNQYRRDSTYTDVIGELGVQYLFEGGNYLKAFWNTASSNLISVDTSAIRQGRAPSQLDVKNRAFGLEASWQQLDYRFNPRKGWTALLKGSAGTRQIAKNQAILSVAEHFYDTLPGRTFKFLLEGKLEFYLPVMQRSALKMAAQSSAILAEEKIFQNEQYRIGGNRTLRGFDEERVFATFYSVFTLEYRLLIGANSYFYTFADYGYVEDRRIGQPDRFDRPLGFGGGLSFETTAGVFGISLAVGKSEGMPVDFRNPKVHFGYVSLF